MGRTRKPKAAPGESSKKTDREMEWCESCECEVPKDKTSLALHFTSESHKRKAKLHGLASFFAKQGLDYFPAGTSFYCQVCCMGVPNSVEDLERHLEKYAQRHGDPVRVPPIAFPVTGSEQQVVVKKTVKLVDFASTNDELNDQLLKLRRVESPITVVESPTGNQIFDLRCDVFTPSELEVATNVISHLERRGRNVSRSEAKGGTRICMWGMRSAYGDTGWYVQDDESCYGLSEDFARFVCKILQREYPRIFEHLESIPDAEGFHGGDAKVGGGPFSSFCTSRDYNCRPHRDEDDYGYGFIFWLRQDAIPKGVEPALFAFPEAEVSFVPKHGDVLCFRPGQYMHCTRRLQKTNLLGMALFQKCSLYRQLGRLIHPGSPGIVEYTSRDGLIKIVETRQGFLEKKKTYLERVEQSTVSISQFMG